MGTHAITSPVHTQHVRFSFFKKRNAARKGEIEGCFFLFFDKSPRNQRRRFHGIFLKIVQTGQEQTDRQTRIFIFFAMRFRQTASISLIRKTFNLTAEPRLFFYIRLSRFKGNNRARIA